MSPNDAPMIFTSKGNMLEADLDYSVAWDVTAEYAKLTETHRERATGEIVKQSAHAYMFKGSPAMGVAASFA